MRGMNGYDLSRTIREPWTDNQGRHYEPVFTVTSRNPERLALKS